MENIIIVDFDNYFSRLYHIQKALNKNKLKEDNDLENLSIIFNNSLKIIDSFTNLIKYNQYKEVIFVYDTKTSKQSNKSLYEQFLTKYNINSEWYKGTREKNENFYIYKKNFQNLLYFLWFKLIWSEKYEADDIIGTLAKKVSKNTNVDILSNDKDLIQILDDNINIIKWISKKDRDEKYTKETFQLEYKIKYWVILNPEDIIYIKCILWDSSDNIKGIKGIWPKTLKKELLNFEQIEKTNIYKENIDFITDLSEIIRLDIDINEDNLKVLKTKQDLNKYNKVLKEIKLNFNLKNYNY